MAETLTVIMTVMMVVREPVALMVTVALIVTGSIILPLTVLLMPLPMYKRAELMPPFLLQQGSYQCCWILCNSWVIHSMQCHLHLPDLHARKSSVLFIWLH